MVVSMLMGKDDVCVGARSKRMERFRRSEGAVHQDDAALQPAGHGRKAEAVNELARARQGTNPILNSGGRAPALGALRGGH
eukprot:15439709-Alexandrium_andersonii.AAC.1